MKIWWLPMLIMAAPAAAANEAACPKDTVCAADPSTLVSAIQEEGYKAKLEKDDLGDPKISSSASGYNFQIFFYGCAENKNCQSIQFFTGFAPADDQTPEYANKWNDGKRFIKAAVTEKKELELKWDLTTVGGLTKENFVDAFDWWAHTLGDFANFVDEQEKAAKAK